MPEGDELAPLVKFPSVPERQQTFTVTGWTLNGTNAPTSGASGALATSGFNASYTAPAKAPSRNPVAVSVSMKGSNREGASTSYMLTSNITVVDIDVSLAIFVDGTGYSYEQYGFNGQFPPDQSLLQIANAAYDATKDQLTIVGGYTDSDAGTSSNAFALAIAHPAQGSVTVRCNNESTRTRPGLSRSARQVAPPIASRTSGRTTRKGQTRAKRSSRARVST